MLLRALLLFLLFVVVVRALWRFLSGVAQGASEAPATRGGPDRRPAMRMVRDPVCGTYVVPGKALELARGRETLYFCSEQCRTRWASER
jgi:YHS domain-containing protein